jgi:hypothetical protein
MWGSTQILEFETFNGFRALSAPLQIARIAYKRPETFRFFAAAQIIGGPDSLGNPVGIVVDFDLGFGVGRAATTTRDDRLDVSGLIVPSINPSFVRLGWVIPAAPSFYATPNNAPKRFTTQSQPRVIDDTTAAPVLTTSDTFSADSCSVEVRAYAYSPTLPPGVYQVQVSWFSSPNVHVRPDWFADEPDKRIAFAGAELRGE